MNEITCPKCGTVVGMADDGMKFSFYHCGVSFPQSKVDILEDACNTSIPLAEREHTLARQVRQLRHRLIFLEKECRTQLYLADKKLAEIRAQRDAAVVFTHDKAKSGVTVSNIPKMKLIMWHFTLVEHARQNGNDAPAQTHDSCKLYASKHQQGGV